MIGRGARSTEKTARFRLWDAPVRLFHWAIVVLFAMSWGSGEYDNLELHRLFGYATLTLVLFRLGWGLAGSDTARFAYFLKGPRAVLAYAAGLARGDAPSHIGHNPLGGWSVMTILMLLLVQCGLGLFAVDVDGIESGPLNDLVSFETGRTVAHLHGAVFNLLLLVVLLHLAAIVFYRLVKRDNLILPMVTGTRPIEPGQAKPVLGFASPWRGLLLLTVAAFLVFALVTRFRI